MKAKLGMSPIAWWNDDLVELSDDVSLEECLRQSRSAGFTGMEKGRRFPDDPKVMLRADLENERNTVAFYRQRIRQCEVDRNKIIRGRTARRTQNGRNSETKGRIKWVRLRLSLRYDRRNERIMGNGIPAVRNLRRPSEGARFAAPALPEREVAAGFADSAA